MGRAIEIFYKIIYFQWNRGLPRRLVPSNIDLDRYSCFIKAFLSPSPNPHFFTPFMVIAVEAKIYDKNYVSKREI